MTDIVERLRERDAPQEDTRSCTCHPDDNPPHPCARRYALAECREAKTQKPPETEPACSNCHWWSPHNSVSGQCHRMPPAAHFEDGHYWPVTGRADWCGEFRLTPPNPKD